MKENKNDIHNSTQDITMHAVFRHLFVQFGRTRCRISSTRTSVIVAFGLMRALHKYE